MTEPKPGSVGTIGCLQDDSLSMSLLEQHSTHENPEDAAEQPDMWRPAFQEKGDFMNHLRVPSTSNSSPALEAKAFNMFSMMLRCSYRLSG